MKTLSRWICPIILCVLLLSLVGAACALPDPVQDQAGLLTQSEEDLLRSRISSIVETYGFQPVILTVYGTRGKSITDYAADYYDYNGYGCGDSNDGLIFAIDMQEREYVTVTTGSGIYAFSDYGIEQMESAVVSYLSSGSYYGAFNAYLRICENYLAQAQTGTPYDIYYGSTYEKKDAREQTIAALPVILLIAGAASGVSIGASVSKMKTARTKETAREYVTSRRITGKNDVFLRASESRMRVVQSPPPSSGGTHTFGGGASRGGSSTFHSSSGVSHGGGHSGKF